MAKKPKAAPSLLTLMERIYRRQTALDQRLTMIVKTQGEIIERLTTLMMVVNSGFPRVNFVGEEWGSGYCETRAENGHERTPPRSITLCADRDSHEPNIPCQVCEWRG